MFSQMEKKHNLEDNSGEDAVYHHPGQMPHPSTLSDPEETSRTQGYCLGGSYPFLPVT